MLARPWVVGLCVRVYAMLSYRGWLHFPEIFYSDCQRFFVLIRGCTQFQSISFSPNFGLNGVEYPSVC